MLMKWEPLSLTLENSKSEEGRGDHQGKIKRNQNKESSRSQM